MRTLHDEGFDGEDDIAILVDISLARLLGRIRTRANLMKEELVDMSIAVRLEGGLCEQELGIILSLEEVAGIALILIDDVHLAITLRAIAFARTSRIVGRTVEGVKVAPPLFRNLSRRDIGNR